MNMSDIEKIVGELTSEAINGMKGLRADELTKAMQRSGDMMKQVKDIVERLANENPEKGPDEIKEMASVELDNLIQEKEERRTAQEEKEGMEQ